MYLARPLDRLALGLGLLQLLAVAGDLLVELVLADFGLLATRRDLVPFPPEILPGRLDVDEVLGRPVTPLGLGVGFEEELLKAEVGARARRRASCSVKEGSPKK